MEKIIYQTIFGIKTEILQLVSPFDTRLHDWRPDVQILMIPGNPGLPLFYRRFALSLLRMLPHAHLQIDIIGYAGHVKKAMTPSEASSGAPVYSLSFQIEHKAHYLRRLLATLHPDTQLVVVGHSIGCFIATKLAANSEFSDRIARLVFLMPTVQWLEVGLAPFIKHFAIRPTGLTLIGHLAQHLPRGCLRLLLGLQRKVSHGDNGAARDQEDIIIDAFLCRTVIHNVFYMARTEVRDVRDLPAHLLTPQLIAKSFFVFTPSDPYTPVALVDSLLTQYPSVQSTQLPAQVPHAFVGCDESIHEVCITISSFLIKEKIIHGPIEFQGRL